MNKRISDPEIPLTGPVGQTDIPGDEDAAKNFLIRAGILRVPPGCPACGSTDIRQIRRNQCRCRECRHEWGIRKDTLLEGTRISFLTFIRLVRLFADDIPANEAAHRLCIAYNTVDNIYGRIRNAVLDTGTGVSVIAGGTDTGGKNNPSELVAFGIRLDNGRVTIRPVNSPSPDIITSLPLPAMKRGNIHFIDAYGKEFQGFISYTPDRNGQEIVRLRARRDLPWSPLHEFWNFAGTAWTSHRGLDRERIPQFVQELAFRYNHRDTDIFRAVLEKMAAPSAIP